jgi:AraC-like DNA-binding protein
MLDALISRSQILADELVRKSVPDLRARLASLVETLPAVASTPERLVIRAVIGYVVSHVLLSGLLSYNSEVGRSFVAWTASSATAADWRASVCLLIGRVVHALAASDAVPTEDGRVRIALKLLDARYNDPTLTREECADAMHLSVWHACRLLKLHTGFGFSAHIEMRRIDAAERHLRDRALIIKEIAAAVGYGSTTQLGRHFRRLRGVTPAEYRRTASVAEPAA